jgi:hypothetical protein
MYDSDDVYRLVDGLSLEWKIREIQSTLESIASQISTNDRRSREEFSDIHQSLSELTPSESLEVVPRQPDNVSLDSILETLNDILAIVNRPNEEFITWPPVIGQVVTLQGWNYPHVVKAVEIEDGAVKYLVGASTQRSNDRDVLVRLAEVLPYKW